MPGFYGIRKPERDSVSFREVEFPEKTITANNDASIILPTISGKIPVASALFNSSGVNTGYVVVSSPEKRTVTGDTSWHVRLINYTGYQQVVSGTLRVMYVAV